jgi:hypothetical protein
MAVTIRQIVKQIDKNKQKITLIPCGSHYLNSAVPDTANTYERPKMSSSFFDECVTAECISAEDILQLFVGITVRYKTET